jgi:hypothetical protein
MGFDAAKEARNLEAAICRRYATAFNAANKSVESGIIQVDLLDLVQGAIQSAYTAGLKRAAEIARGPLRKRTTLANEWARDAATEIAKLIEAEATGGKHK